ncbi:MAG: class I SAM-dependent methyltransferase [candidate division Zixibacteria bacterium]|nr:class I SAM-dependent methyltransferase [candidate division Zixibacteria bacterium]
MSDKFERLDKISDSYNSEVDFDRYLIEFNFDVLQHHLCGDQILEMGCASGVMTRLLLTKVARLDVVDGSQKYIDQLKPELGGQVRFELALFEDYDTSKKYTDIILARALEHIDDPVALLSKMARWLTPDRAAAIHIVVPNADSLHRRIGVAMGMLPSVTALSERDHKYGHKRVYTRPLLEEHITKAGLQVVHAEGIYLKPLANAQMEQWPRNLIDAYYRVGKQFSDACAELYVKCAVRR